MVTMPTRPTTTPATLVATPVFDGAQWDEEEKANKHLTIQQALTNLHPESPHPEYGEGGRMIRPDGKAQLYNGRTGEPFERRRTKSSSVALSNVTSPRTRSRVSWSQARRNSHHFSCRIRLINAGFGPSYHPCDRENRQWWPSLRRLRANVGNRGVARCVRHCPA